MTEEQERVILPLSTPAEILIRDLEQLRVLLKKLCATLDESGVERTFHLRRIMGQDCQHYKKSLNLFVDNDYDPIRELIADVNDQFILLEGKTLNGKQ